MIQQRILRAHSTSYAEGVQVQSYKISEKKHDILLLIQRTKNLTSATMQCLIIKTFNLTFYSFIPCKCQHIVFKRALQQVRVYL